MSRVVEYYLFLAWTTLNGGPGELKDNVSK